jgi:UMF1 family MFS transporter
MDYALKNRTLPIVSWALYDFANTIFSILVVTRYLPPLLKEITGASSPLGGAVALSMLLAGILVPVMGAVSDLTGRSRRYLTVTTILCVAATCGISFTQQAPLMLGLFLVANLAYQVSMVFYNSLLPTVCAADKVGTVSGLGVALGYVGSFFALLLAGPYVRAYGVERVFVLAGGLFLLFSLPIFFGVAKRPGTPGAALSRELVADRFRRVLGTVRELPSHRSMLYFLLGNFFCLDAVNTTIIFYSEYLIHARGFPGRKVDLCLIAVQLSALCFSLWIGRRVDRAGSRPMLLWVTVVWIVVIGLVLLTGSYPVVLLASVIGGFGLGGIWVAGRTMILELSPPQRVGEFMGLYGMTGKFSAVGALAFGLLADLFSYDRALMFQIGMLLVGYFFFSRIAPGTRTA